MNVKCYGCKRIHHETTEHYQENSVINGSFIKLVDPYKSWGWNCYDDGGAGKATTTAALMLCPSCGMPLVRDGKLNVVYKKPKIKELTQAEKNQVVINEFEIEDADPLECKICGKICKSLSGLKSHIRMKHNDR